MEQKHCLEDPNRLIVQNAGREIRILSAFAPGKNILTRFLEGNQLCYFLPADQPLEAFADGELFHAGWDDLAPWSMGGYEMLGANHGSIFAFRVHLLRHWLFAEDVGRWFSDDAGHRFMLIAVENFSDLIFHSECLRDGGRIRFHRAIQGVLHGADGRTVVPESVQQIQLPGAADAQLSIHHRYNRVRLTADGTELRAGESRNCSEAQLEWDLDLCGADALLAYLEKHPGRPVAPHAPELAGMLHNHLTFTFAPHNVLRAEASVTFVRDIDHPVLYGLLQYWGAKHFQCQEKFVPKLRPFSFADFYHTPETVDLGGIYTVPERAWVCRTFSAGDCVDPDDPPCRYYDFFGDGTRRELGVVLGYSVCKGLTRRGAGRGGINLVLPLSGKIYPYGFSVPGVKKGDRFTLAAYRQFFVPLQEGQGAVFGHWEDGNYLLHADFAEPYTGTVEFPAELAGREFTIWERYGTVTLPGTSRVAPDGKVAFCAGARSGFVLRITANPAPHSL